MQEFWRFIKFALFSASAGLIEIGAFALLNELTGWSYWPCYLIALLLSILWNFTLNRKFTFRSAANVPVAMMKVLGCSAVFVPATTLLGDYLADTLMWNEYLVTGINMALNFTTEFLFQRRAGQPRKSGNFIKRNRTVEVLADILEYTVEKRIEYLLRTSLKQFGTLQNFCQ